MKIENIYILHFLPYGRAVEHSNSCAMCSLYTLESSWWMCVSCVHGAWCGVVCRFRSLHCLSLSLWGVEELSGVERNDLLLSLSMETESDNSRPLKLLLCLEVALSRGWFGLSIMGQEPVQRPSLCCYRCQAVQLRISERACLPQQSVQMCCVPFPEAAPLPAHSCMHEGARDHCTMASREFCSSSL